MTEFTLRPYQTESIDRCFAMWEAASPLQRIAIQLPTGAGKTVVFTKLIRKAREERGFGTALVLAHRDELVQQAVDKLRKDDPTLRVGIVKAAQNEVTDVDVIVGSVQTLHRDKRLAQLPPIDLVIVDEAHHVVAASYVKILTALGCYREGGPWLLGVSATLERNDDKRLADVFQDIAHQIDILDLVPEFLVEPKAKAIGVQDFDLTGVRIQAGDLAEKDLAEALDRSGAYGVVAAAYVEHAKERSGIVFCPNIATSERMAEVFCEWGIDAEAISSRTHHDERKAILARYQAGVTQVITNCAVLTEGFDAPHTSCVVIARPTKSRTLYSQMVGRGLRLHPESGKTDCLVLDLVGVAGRHELCTIADLTKYEIKDVRDFESLPEAAERTRTEKVVKTRGTLRARDIDLLRRASNSPIRDGWFLTTAGGTPFIKVTDAEDQESFFWIEEIPGYHHVVMWGAAGQQPICISSGTDYGMAAEIVRQEALGLTGMKVFIDPAARWRRAPFEDCKPGQVAFAERLGIQLDDEPTKGVLSDRITVCTTGARIDSWIGQNRSYEAA